MSNNRKTEQQTSIHFLGSPYNHSEKDTMDDWYECYKADGAAIIEMDGKPYYRIISKWALTRGNETFAMCNVDGRLWKKGQHRVMDENGHIFEYVDRVHFVFRRAIPDWYTEAPEVELSGDIYTMGEYLSAVD